MKRTKAWSSESGGVRPIAAWLACLALGLLILWGGCGGGGGGPAISRPAAPTSKRAPDTPGTVVLTWAVNPEPEVTGYNVYRRIDPETKFTKVTLQPVVPVGGSPTATYSDILPAGAESGDVYYRITAVASGGESKPSDTVRSFAPPPPPPGL